MTATNAFRSAEYVLERKAAEAFSRWLRQMIHDDKNGRYIAFSLNTRYELDTLRALMEERTWMVAHDVHGLTREDTGAKLRAFGIFFFLLPATSSSGNKHYHGMIRIPANDVPEKEHWTWVNIKEQGKTTPLFVPRLVADLLFPRSRQSGNSAFGDLHLRNDGTHLSFLDWKSPTAESVLQYWMKESDGELRHFSEGEFVPHKVRAALPIRQGRQPRRKPGPRRSRKRLESVPAHRETVEEFLSRGGGVLIAPPGPAPEPTLPRHRRPRRASAGWNRRAKGRGTFQSSLRLSWRS